MIVGHNSDVELSFYNDRVKEIIDASIIAEPFTYVPIKAGHMELVGGNALVFGKITEGYDTIALDIESEITYEDISLLKSRIDLQIEPQETNRVEIVVDEPPRVYREITGSLVVQLPLIPYIDSYYYISMDGVVASYKAVEGNTVADIKVGLEASLTAVGIGFVAESESFLVRLYERTISLMNSPDYQVGDVYTMYQNTVKSAYILSLGYTFKHPQLKRGAVHAFGIVYKDRANRVCSVLKNRNTDIYIPFYTEVTGIGNLLESVVNITFKIGHKPPDWAEIYEIVYFGNISMDYFLQLRADNIVSLGNHRYSLNIQKTIDDIRDKNNRWKVSSYIWNLDGGDRLRIMGTVYYGGVIGGNWLYDYEIEETGTQYDEEAIGGDWLIFQAKDPPIPFAGETNILVEVYRPRKGLGQTIAYGTGMIFDIDTDINGRKYHKGDINQVFDSNGVCTVRAEVDNTIIKNGIRITRASDCWKYIRLNYKYDLSDIEPFWAESIFPSDWWSNQIVANKLTSMGFQFLDDLSQRQTILDERIRHGGFLITGTRTNNIAHFTYDDYMDLPKKNGDIIGLREVGFTLKVIQMYKETSIYINRIQTFNPDGTEQFTLTDKFLAEQRPMETDYGCQHPDSIMVNGRNLYYWDNSEGVFIRSSPNGQVVLDIKMKRWFKDLVRWIQISGGGETLQTRTGANNDHDEVWLTFRMGDEVRGIIFSEKQGRYISRINQITESYVHLGNFFAHLYHQRVWIMNVDEGQDYLTWGGVPTYAEIEVVSNIEPVRNKVYNAIALFADHELNSLPKYVYIPAEASAGNSLMESNVPIWDRREGVFFGEILKDENSKGNFISLNDRKMNGNAMRGRYCFVKFNTEEHTEKVRIDSIVIMSTLSERNV
jgi:hypothetical protein